MKRSRLLTFTGACALAGVLVACSNEPRIGGVGTIPAAASPATERHSWMAPGVASGDLLYVADDNSGAVFVYTYNPPAMKFAGVLTGAGPGPMCVDKQQNVWIVADNGFTYAATEYAHGGTAPIAVLMDPAGPPTGCAVDPTTGNLALSSTPAIYNQTAAIAIFHHERGKALVYDDPAVPGFYTCCTYDHQGNLYGYGSGDGDGGTVIVELPKGSNAFASIDITPGIESPDGIQWIGKYLTIADNGFSPGIDEFALTENGPKKIRAIPLNGTTSIGQYDIDGNHVIVPSRTHGDPGFVGLYHYPDGGDPIRSWEFSAPAAVVLSRGQH